MRPVVLSGRLRAVASMVTQGSRVCDVGCDHGFVSIYLVEQKISPYVLAMDVREGPLGAAKEHVSKRGLGPYIETRLSDGLHNYEAGEADSLVCAGMGGRLMMRILGADRAKTDSFRELILQPQSEVGQFRAWLREQGYRVADEKMVEEDGKFYPMMRVTACGERLPGGILPGQGPWPYGGVGCGTSVSQDELLSCGALADRFGREMLWKLFDRYGAFLLIKKDSTLKAYLKREERIYGEIMARLAAEGLSCVKRRERYGQVETLLGECRAALEIISAG